MDQTIYEPTTQKLFGVRGQWVFKFNSVTGALEDSLRFMTDINGTSTITAVAGKLYIGVSWQPTINWSASPPTCPDVDIYVVDAASFTVFSRLNLFGNISPSSSGVHFGWRTIAAGGNGLIGYYLSGGGLKLFNCATDGTGFTSVAHQGVTDIAWDATNSVIWIPSSFDPDIFCYDPNFASFNTCFDTNGNLNTICGITYWKDPSGLTTGRIYAVDGTFNFYYFDTSLAVPAFANFLVSVGGSTFPINANPFRIKAVNNLPLNPYNGKILVPCWADNTVQIIDPSGGGGGTITPKAGFTAPWDIVSTPTKNFAVQTGTVGLKEIV